MSEQEGTKMLPEERAAEKAQFVNSRARNQFAVEFVLRAYIAAGLMTAVGGVLYFVGNMLDIVISDTQRLALIFAGSGVMISVLSWLVLNYRRERERFQTQEYLIYLRQMEVVEAWEEFESLSKRLLSKENEEFNRYSLRSIIDALRRENTLDVRDVDNLRRALDIRNLIVHRNLKLDVDTSKKWASEISRINEKLARQLTAPI